MSLNPRVHNISLFGRFDHGISLSGRFNHGISLSGRFKFCMRISWSFSLTLALIMFLTYGNPDGRRELVGFMVISVSIILLYSVAAPDVEIVLCRRFVRTQNQQHMYCASQSKSGTFLSRSIGEIKR